MMNSFGHSIVHMWTIFRDHWCILKLSSALHLYAAGTRGYWLKDWIVSGFFVFTRKTAESEYCTFSIGCIDSTFRSVSLTNYWLIYSFGDLKYSTYFGSVP